MLAALLLCGLAAAWGNTTRVVVSGNVSAAHNLSVVRWTQGGVVLDLGRPVEAGDADMLTGVFGNDSLVEEDSMVTSVLVEQLQAEGEAWQYLDREAYSLQMEYVWYNLSYLGNASVLVAVLDGGLAQAAMGLFASLAEGYDFISDPELSMDGDGWDPSPVDPGYNATGCPPPFHGTMMAGVIAGRGGAVDGFMSMQPLLTLLPARVLGLCSMGYASDVADAVVWVAGGNVTNVPLNPRPCSVISMSFAGLGGCPSFLQAAVDFAVARGVILVASAGNDAGEVGEYFPANCRGVVVAASSTRQGMLADYSNRGELVQVAAPGGDVPDPIYTVTVSGGGLALVAGYGSSFSAAFVAGMMGLKLSIGLTPLPGSAFFDSELKPFSSACDECGGGIDSGWRLVHGNRTRLVQDVPWNYTGVNGSYPWVVATTTCPTGTYQTSTTTSICISCLPGYLSTGLGMVSCLSCVAGSYTTLTGASTCVNCKAGMYSKPGGPTTCLNCTAGTYASGTGILWCALCSAGTYTSIVGGTACANCSAGTYSSAQGLTTSAGCSACSAGTYSSATGVAQVCTPPSTSWLFKSQLTAYYYLTLPAWINPNTLNSGYTTYNFGSGTTTGNTQWNKVRINSTLSYNLTSILLYVQAMNQVQSALCPSCAASAQSCTACPCVVNSGQFDATYAIYPSNPAFFTDFGSTGSCGWGGSAYIVNIVGTPFNITYGAQSWQCAVCAWSYRCAFTCFNSQNCSVVCDGNCGGSTFIGVLSVINTTQFQNDVNVSCKLYPYDPLLSCTGSESVAYTCSGVPCQTCSAGSFARSGASACAYCAAGAYSSGSGASLCSACPAGSFSGSNATVCGVCGTGSFSGSNASVCSQCQAGSFSNASNTSACSQCQAGSFSASNSTNCGQCQVGNYSGVGAGACLPCPVGLFSNVSQATACLSCQAGYYQSHTSQSVCGQCYAGTYQSLSAQSVCVQCVAGTYASSTGQTLCQQCPTSEVPATLGPDAPGRFQ